MIGKLEIEVEVHLTEIAETNEMLLLTGNKIIIKDPEGHDHMKIDTQENQDQLLHQGHTGIEVILDLLGEDVLGPQEGIDINTEVGPGPDQEDIDTEVDQDPIHIEEGGVEAIQDQGQEIDITEDQDQNLRKRKIVMRAKEKRVKHLLPILI